jgi:hypothetical protein
MQKNQKKEVSNNTASKEPGDSGDPLDSMDSYWEKLRVDGQFGRGQKPATD